MAKRPKVTATKLTDTVDRPIPQIINSVRKAVREAQGSPQLLRDVDKLCTYAGYEWDREQNSLITYVKYLWGKYVG